MPDLLKLPPNFAAALKLIDAAHAEDPRTAPGFSTGSSSSTSAEPYELRYARKMTRWLSVRCPDASPVLQLACRAQHFRRWEIPRSSYPMTRAGYLTWRAKQKTQAASQVAALLQQRKPADASSSEPLIPPTDAERVAALIRKEGLASGGGAGEEEAQVLEDVACLVFLDDQFDDFTKSRVDSAEAGAKEKVEGQEEDEEEVKKIVTILQKTWKKMSPAGREIALGMPLSDRAKGLVERALAG